MFETKMFVKARNAGVFILGICRGAQLACALTGGFLVQHVEGHGHAHHVTTIDGQRFLASSLHHQMMFPWDIKHELLAWSTVPRSPYYKGVTDEEFKRWPRKIYDELKEEDLIEPEIIWFPESKCLGVQGHPEMMKPDCPHNLYIKKCINERLLHPT